MNLFVRPAALVCAAFITAVPALVQAAEPTRDDAVALVKKAAAAYKAAGKDKLLAEVGTENGPYHKGELYVFAYDLSGVIVAHPVNPKLVGKNTYEVPDVDGKFYRKEIIDNARAGKSGWVDYKYKNPASGKVEHKVAYYEPVGEIVAVAGIYK